MSLIQTFPDGGGGGTNIPNGSTVTPTDNIQIWLKCAELTETYTTLNEVLADDDIMEKLFRSENASDYLVRSTTWTTDIVADQTAMILIGANDYCANKLVNDSTWGMAIAGSAYWDRVLVGLVPTMIDATYPSGEVTATSYDTSGTGYQPYKAFDGNYDYSSNGWMPSGLFTASENITYNFITKTLNVCKIKVYYKGSGGVNNIYFKVQSSSDGVDWSDITNEVTFTSVVNQISSADYTVNNIINGKMFRLAFTQNSTSTSGYGLKIQFYGRELKTTIYSAANDIVSFVDDEGAKVVTTDSTGKGEVNIVCKPNTDITFTSSVAKNPDNLSENYSKVVMVKSSVEPVYVMPNNNVLYWYGYFSNDCEVVSNANGWNYSNTAIVAPTINTNNVYCSSASGTTSAIAKKTVLNGESKVNVIWEGDNSVGSTPSYLHISNIPSKTGTYGASHEIKETSKPLAYLQDDISAWSNYLIVNGINGRTGYIYAVWLGNNEDKNYIEQDITLSTSAVTNATFTSSKIKSDSVIEVFAGRSTGDVQGAKNQFPYDSVYTTNGSCVVTYPIESSAITITVRIYIRG